MKKILIAIVTTLVLTGCLSGIKYGKSSQNSDFFNFLMKRQVIADFSMPFEGVGTEVFISTRAGIEPDENAMKLTTLTADANGNVITKLAVPTYAKELWVKAEHAGVNGSYIRLPVQNGKISYDYVAAYQNQTKRYDAKRIMRAAKRAGTTPAYKYMGTWNSLGLPNYLDSKKDTLSSNFSNLINNTYLPTTSMVNAAYLANGTETNLNITSDAAVWVGYFTTNNTTNHNSLGYYTYETSKGPPDGGVTDGAITIVFPNTNIPSGKGITGLTPGDRVNIGTFKAGTTIAWVLITDGFNTKTQQMTFGTEKFYSDELYNPEIDIADRPHAVLLNMYTASSEKKLVFGFKDSYWGTNAKGANDFNDFIFYTNTTDPKTNADNTLTAVDTKYIVDPAYDSAKVVNRYVYTPGVKQYSTLAFKDLWPYLGDYDFNDAIVDYNFTEVLDGTGGITRIIGNFFVRVSLAGMNNGFAIELPIDSQYISSVSGYKKVVIGTNDPLHQEYFFFKDPYGKPMTRAEVPGLEMDDVNNNSKGNNRAVILVCDNIKQYLNQQISVTITFNRSIKREELGFAPYNPFIMSNGERGREVHLPGQPPTKFSNKPYFQTQDDKSRLGTTYTYKDENGNPWALDIPESFYYPYDGVSIKEAYLHFDEWVQSEGKLSSDWYRDLPGYRDNTKIARK